MVVLEVSSISTQDLRISARVTIGFLVTSLNKAVLPRLLSLAERPGCSKLLPFKNYAGHCALGNLQCSKKLLSECTVHGVWCERVCLHACSVLYINHIKHTNTHTHTHTHTHTQTHKRQTESESDTHTHKQAHAQYMLEVSAIIIRP